MSKILKSISHNYTIKYLTIKLQKNWQIPIFLLIAAILVFIWFKEGKFLAGGEEGFSIWESERMLKLFKSPWFETGTGIPMPFYLPRVPLYLFTALLEKFLSPVHAQATIFWLLISMGTMSMFYLTKELIKENKIALFAGIFYFLNLYSLLQVWGRFQFSGILAWAYLPLFLFLWLKWLGEGKFFWFVSFLASSIIFSHTFSMPAHLFTFWVPALILILSESLRRENATETLKTTFRAVFISFFWIVSNLWWIYPVGNLVDSLSVELAEYSVGSLRGVSQFFPMSEIFLLRHKFLLEQGQFTGWFTEDFAKALSVLVFILVTLGVIKIIKMGRWRFLLPLSLVGLFVIKGANSPFGLEFFRWLFEVLPPAQTLRNPYEKFGLVWALPYSIFFASGVFFLHNRLASRLKITVPGLLLFLSCVVLVWPMWTGDVFGYGVDNVRVKLPEYYERTNNFLNKLDSSDSRLLMLPIIPGDGVKYEWKDGAYKGVEPSEFLFDRPAVSKVLRAKYFDNKYMALYNSFVADENYNKFLEQMNIKYLVLHEDIEPEISGATPSAKIREILAENQEIIFLQKFGGLEIYEFTNNKEGSLFEVQGKVIPESSYQKSPPTSYRVDIHNATEPFTLIFKSTFNELWEARIGGKEVDNHFLVYNYANGWKINKKGSYSIDVVFKVWPWE